MAVSRTSVINLALQSIAANGIADPDEDTESARQAKVCYDQVVRREIATHPWYFAKEQAALPANAGAPLYKFARSFNLPSAFLRLVELEQRWVFSMLRNIDTNPVPPYEIQGRAILTDFGAPLNITYLADKTDEPSLWPPEFVQAAAMALAVRLAYPLTKSDGAVKMAKENYAEALTSARKNNAIQRPPGQMPDGSWMAARGLA